MRSCRWFPHLEAQDVSVPYILRYSERRSLVLNLSKYDYFDCSLRVLEQIDGFEILNNRRLWRILLLIFRQFYMWNFIGLLFYDFHIW